MSPKLKPEVLEERKAQILEAALTCFARKGYHQTTMDDIVQAAGLSKGGVYWHFGSKKELFLSLFESLFSDTEAVVLASLQTDKSATEKLSDVMQMYTLFAVAEEFNKVMPLMIDVWAQNWQDPAVNQAAVTIYNHFRAPLEQLIKEGIASGEFKPVDVSSLASIIFAIYDGLMVQAMIDESLVNWTLVNQTVMDTLVAGLLAGEPKGQDRSI